MAWFRAVKHIIWLLSFYFDMVSMNIFWSATYWFLIMEKLLVSVGQLTNISVIFGASPGVVACIQR